MSKKPTCAYIDPSTEIRCHRVPKYLQCLTLHGTSKPRNVLLCDTCDRQQGRKTLTEKHGWLLDDAIKWERDPDRTGSLKHAGTEYRLTPKAIRSQEIAQRKKQYEQSRINRAYAITTLYG